MTVPFFLSLLVALYQYIPDSKVKNLEDYSRMTPQQAVTWAHQTCKHYNALDIGDVFFSPENSQKNEKKLEKKLNALDLSFSEFQRLYQVFCKGEQPPRIVNQEMAGGNGEQNRVISLSDIQVFLSYFRKRLGELPSGEALGKVAEMRTLAPLLVVSELDVSNDLVSRQEPNKISVNGVKKVVLGEVENPLRKQINKRNGVELQTTGAWVSSHQIPLKLKQALISAEDKGFYSHSGIEYSGIARAFLKSNQIQGGSTLTQQLIKNLYFRDEIYGESRLNRKVKEILIAGLFEKKIRRAILIRLAGGESRNGNLFLDRVLKKLESHVTQVTEDQIVKKSYIKNLAFIDGRKKEQLLGLFDVAKAKMKKLRKQKLQKAQFEAQKSDLKKQLAAEIKTGIVDYLKRLKSCVSTFNFSCLNSEMKSFAKKDFIDYLAKFEAKEKILEVYLNVIYFGSRTYGVSGAANKYFGKSVKELNLSEVSLLASLPKSPSVYIRKSKFERLKQRQGYVLNNMKGNGFISKEDVSIALGQVTPLGRYSSNRSVESGYMVNGVQQALQKISKEFGPNFLYNENGDQYVVDVSYDLLIQALAQKALREGLVDYEFNYEKGNRKVFPLAYITWDQKTFEESKELEEKALAESQDQDTEKVSSGGEVQEAWRQALMNLKSTPPLSGWKKAVLLKTGGQFVTFGLANGKKFTKKNGFLSPIVTDVEKQGHIQFPKTYEQFRVRFEAFGPELQVVNESNQLGIVESIQGGTLNFRVPQRGALVKGKISLDFRQVAHLKKGDIFFFYRDNQRGGKIVPYTATIGVGDVFWVRQDAKKSYQLVSEPRVNGALVILDKSKGNVLASVGGFKYSAVSPFNFALNGLRQPGSSVKPMAYLTALDKGLDINYPISDNFLNSARHRFPVLRRGERLWGPRNYDGSVLGQSVPMAYGLIQSRNLMTAHLLPEIGYKLGYHDPQASQEALSEVSSFMKRFQIYSDWGEAVRYSSNNYFRSDVYFYDSAKLPKHLNYPLVLGARETSPLRLATAFARIGGDHLVVPQIIKGIKKVKRAGNAQETAEMKSYRVDSVLYDNKQVQIGQHDSYFMTPLKKLRYLLMRAISDGTGTRIKELYPYIAGKTGTTNDSRDVWFSGFTDKLSFSVWVGYGSGEKNLNPKASGGRVALPVVKKFFESLKKFSEVPEVQKYLPQTPILTDREIAELFQGPSLPSAETTEETNDDWADYQEPSSHTGGYEGFSLDRQEGTFLYYGIKGYSCLLDRDPHQGRVVSNCLKFNEDPEVARQVLPLYHSSPNMRNQWLHCRDVRELYQNPNMKQCFDLIND